MADQINQSRLFILGNSHHESLVFFHKCLVFKYTSDSYYETGLFQRNRIFYWDKKM